MLVFYLIFLHGKLESQAVYAALERVLDLTVLKDGTHAARDLALDRKLISLPIVRDGNSAARHCHMSLDSAEALYAHRLYYEVGISASAIPLPDAEDILVEARDNGTEHRVIVRSVTERLGPILPYRGSTAAAHLGKGVRALREEIMEGFL